MQRHAGPCRRRKPRRMRLNPGPRRSRPDHHRRCKPGPRDRRSWPLRQENRNAAEAIIFDVTGDQNPGPDFRLPGEGCGAYGVARRMGRDLHISYHYALSNGESPTVIFAAVAYLQCPGGLHRSHRRWRKHCRLAVVIAMSVRYKVNIGLNAGLWATGWYLWRKDGSRTLWTDAAQVCRGC